MARTRFWVSDGLTPDEYHSLLYVVALISSTFGMVEFTPHGNYPRPTLDLLNRLEPYLVGMDDVTEWPGTKTYGHPRCRLLFQARIPVVDLIAQATDSLWDWVNSRFPDDLHFLRQDGSVVMGSTWCTRAAWLDLDSDDEKILRTRLATSVNLETDRL